MKQEFSIQLTGRHVSVTDAMKTHVTQKLQSIELQFPKIIDAQAILEVEKYRHICEIILTCNSHIKIEAKEESDDMYTSIDRCLDKVLRQMRKQKTKVQNPRPDKKANSPQRTPLTSEGATFV